MNEKTDQDGDVELLRRIGAKDRAAFAEFYDKYSSLLFSLAAKILNNAAEAEDVLQEVFAQIWDKADSFDPQLGKPLSWVITLTRNKAIDSIRGSVRRSRLLEEATVEFFLDGQAGVANETVHGRERSESIRSAVTELPGEQRHAIEMAFFSGLTQNEISEKLHEPLGTVKARIRRGLLKLRNQLEGVL
ncbi:MAG: sigma-70 family RNA polymerase sigma factor [Limisphaerales bacterium]